MSLKNLLIRGMVACAKPFRKTPPSRRKRFLIVSTTGLGDTLWATPAIRSLRLSYPRAYIAVLTSPVGKTVLKNNPHIDALFLLKNPLIFFALRKQAFDTILIFHASQRVVFPLCYFLGAGELIGTEGLSKGLDSLLTTAIKPHRTHEIARRLQMTAHVGAQTTDFSLEMPFSRADEQEALRALKTDFPIVGLNPGAKDLFKQWDPECFVEVGKRLHHHLGCQIVVTGGKHERDLVQGIASQIPGAIALAGELSLGGLCALIKRMNLMISNDTGPMHIAFAMKTPTVALFCPTDPKLCGPYHPTFPVAVIAKAPSCTPCLRKKCQSPFCLLQISPAEVYDTALKLYYTVK